MQFSEYVRSALFFVHRSVKFGPKDFKLPDDTQSLRQIRPRVVFGGLLQDTQARHYLGFPGQNVTLLRKYQKRIFLDSNGMFFGFNYPKIGGVLMRTF